jgi:hypothetical protein
MNPSRVEKWQRWLEPLQNDVTSLHVNREIWNCMAQTIDANPDIPRSVALVFIRSNYVTSQAVAIRRLAEPSSRVVSFAGLLTEIAQCPEDLTAASVLPAGSARERPRWEHEFAAGKSGGHVDPAKVSDHLSTLGATVGTGTLYGPTFSITVREIPCHWGTNTARRAGQEVMSTTGQRTAV